MLTFLLNVTGQDSVLISVCLTPDEGAIEASDVVSQQQLRVVPILTFDFVVFLRMKANYVIVQIIAQAIIHDPINRGFSVVLSITGTWSVVIFRRHLRRFVRPFLEFKYCVLQICTLLVFDGALDYRQRCLQLDISQRT